MADNALASMDVIQRGQELYEREIRAKVEPGENGKMLAVDIDTGEYAVGDDSITALTRLKSKRPDSRAYILRVGYPTAVKIGIGRMGNQS